MPKNTNFQPICPLDQTICFQIVIKHFLSWMLLKTVLPSTPAPLWTTGSSILRVPLSPYPVHFRDEESGQEVKWIPIVVVLSVLPHY